MENKNSYEKIIHNHQNLEEKLAEIPANRKITYIEKIEENKLIGKPRFKDRYYEWDPELFVSLRNHLQEIWNFFSNYSYWFDNRLKEILFYDERRLNKKSIIFLLETDVWETDEVYGNYLIDLKGNTTDISYFRFSTKFKTFSFENMNNPSREKWIKIDAPKQVKMQFKILWKQIEIEIITCQEEKFHPPIPFDITDVYLKSQFEICRNLISTSKEAALLMLGRIEEFLLLKSMNITHVPFNERLLPLAEVKGVVDKSNKRLFSNIRTQYNRLKHRTDYSIDNCDVEELIEKFCNLVDLK